jgi:hypothetical protein
VQREPGKKETSMINITSAADGRNSVIKHAFDLPFGYRATFIWGRPDWLIEVRWSPDLPRIRKPRPQRRFLAAYQAARREFFEEVAAVVGGRVLIFDTDLRTIRGHEAIVPPTQH